MSLFEYQKVVLTKHWADLKLHFELNIHRESTKTEMVDVLLEHKNTFPLGESLIDDMIEAMLIALFQVNYLLNNATLPSTPSITDPSVSSSRRTKQTKLSSNILQKIQKI